MYTGPRPFLRLGFSHLVALPIFVEGDLLF